MSLKDKAFWSALGIFFVLALVFNGALLLGALLLKA